MKLSSLCHSRQVRDQNDMQALGVCRFISEEFGKKDRTLVALYYNKIRSESASLLFQLHHKWL